MKPYLSLAAAFVLLTTAGCSRGDGVDPIGGDGNLNITFYNAETGVGDITVTFDNSRTAEITQSKVATTCKTLGCANFTAAAGPHTFKAVSTTGWEWEGTLSIPVGANCSTYVLEKSKGTKYNNMSFWNNENGLGTINVTVDNTLDASITQKKMPIGCKEQGCANFKLTAGTHNYTAISPSTGIKWSGSFTANSDCDLFELFK